MTYTLADLKSLFQLTNVRAMSHVVRERESNQNDDAYTLVNGGAHFSPPLSYNAWRHPWHGIPTTQGAKACGAYQHLGTTWAGLASKYGIPDFSPPSQDAGFVGGLIERGALEDVIAGRFEQAVLKLRKEWTSLPGASESSSNWTMEKALAVFKKYGGGVSTSVTVGQEPAAPAPSPEPTRSRSNMDPITIFSIFGPLLAKLIPQIASIVKPESEVAKRNVELAGTVVNTILDATKSQNMQEAVEKMQADPEVKKEVQQAVVTQPTVMEALQIVEVGGGAKAAAERDVLVMQQEKPFWKTSAVFWVSILLLPMVYWYVGSSVVGGIEIPSDWPWYAQLPLKLFGAVWDAGARVGLANLVIGLVLGGICGVYYGISVTQAKQQAAEKASSNQG